MIGLNLRIVELGLVIGFIEKNREKKREKNGPKKAPMQIHGSHFSGVILLLQFSVCH